MKTIKQTRTMNKAYIWALILLLATAPQLRGQAELVRDIQQGPSGSWPTNFIEHSGELTMRLWYPISVPNVTFSPVNNQWRERVLLGPLQSAGFSNPFLRRGNLLYGYFDGFDPNTGMHVGARIGELNLDTDRFSLIESTEFDSLLYPFVYGTTNAIIEEVHLYDTSRTRLLEVSLRAYDILRRRWQTILSYTEADSTFFLFNATASVGDRLVTMIESARGRHIISHHLGTGLRDTLRSASTISFHSFFYGLAPRPVEFGNRLYLSGYAHDSLTGYTPADELYAYIPENNLIRRVTRNVTAGFATSMSALGSHESLVLTGTYNSDTTSPARVIAYEPSSDRWRRIAELSGPMQGYTVTRFHSVGNQLYIEAEGRPGVNGLPFRLCRILLPGSGIMADSALRAVEPLLIPGIPASANISNRSVGATTNWLYVLGRVPSSQNNFGYEDVLFVLHVPTQRWMSTLRMSPAVGSGVIIYFSKPAEAGGDLYFMGVGDQVGHELFRFRADGTTSVEAVPASDAKRFRLSPNPTSGRVSLAAPDGIGDVRYRLLNAMGQEIAGGAADRPGVEVALSRAFEAAAPGLYLVTLTGGGRTEQHRVLRTSN